MDVLASFHPVVRAWFRRAFEGPTPAQERGWTEIRAGHDTLIAAPTGSGKTLAAFLAAIDGIVCRGEAAGAGRGIDVVYVSPLKALSSDVQKNLQAPIEGIRAAAAELGERVPAIRAALRTGDTTPAERAAITRDPPNILVTTPESLYLMLTAERTRALLRRVRTVVVDEVHALLRDKRGSHLALSLARLDALADRRPQRVGLSATVHPIETAARFLAGTGRPCAIVDAGHRRDLDLGIELPGTDLEAVATNEQWAEIYDRVASLVREHRTTLVFVNTRRMAERVAHHLGERLGEQNVAAHHGSLAKERRLRVEQRLKAGEMRALVATASLELGIDVGTVDLVCQIGSPRAVTTFLQRIGRSGHALGRTSRGRLFATTRDELVECRDGARARREGRPASISVAPLSRRRSTFSRSRSWPSARRASTPRTASTRALRTAAPYAGMNRAAFDAVVALLAEGVAPRAGRAGALLHRDRVQGRLRGRRGARLVAATNGGAIPDVADYRVVLDPDETLVGTVNEDWAIESAAGDVFVLGSHAWQIRRVENRQGVVRVHDATGRTPTVPFWPRRGPVAHLGAVRRGEPPAPGRGGASGGSPRRRGRMARRRVLPRRRGRRADDGLRARAARRPGPRSDDAGRGVRALLRRVGRDAARRPRAVRRARQPGARARDAQALLPHVRLRAAGGGDRRRDRPVDGHGPRLPPGRRVSPRAARSHRRDASSRPCSRRRCSGRAGGGTLRGRSRCCGRTTERRCRPSFSACGPTICWRPSSPPRSRARTTRRRARSSSRTTRSSGRRCTTACRRPWTSAGCGRCSAASTRGTSGCMRATRPSRRRSRTRC